MRVRFLRSIASFDWEHHAGQVKDVDDALALAWCLGPRPIAERVEPEAAVIAGPPERAMKPRARGRK